MTEEEEVVEAVSMVQAMLMRYYTVYDGRMQQKKRQWSEVHACSGFANLSAPTISDYRLTAVHRLKQSKGSGISGLCRFGRGSSKQHCMRVHLFID